MVSQNILVIATMCDGPIVYRVSLAESWRRRGKFEDVKFVFPNAPEIPITVVCVQSLCKCQ